VAVVCKHQLNAQRVHILQYGRVFIMCSLMHFVPSGSGLMTFEAMIFYQGPHVCGGAA
jgi:hypothetical protein